VADSSNNNLDNAVAYFEGKYLPLAEAKVNIMTHAFKYGRAVFKGIACGTIAELVRDSLGLQIHCRPIDRSELHTADELFYSGTGAQIESIGSVDNRPIGKGQAGPLASKVRYAYIDVCRGNNSKYQTWLTPVFPIAQSKTSVQLSPAAPAIAVAPS
jgi:branched-subunit amino acid aminotransferase/4-amino-4-deoxychorismate lyase